MKIKSAALPFFVLLSSLSALLATTYTPRTSEATMLASPLAAGETAYVAEDDGTATAYIGADAGPLRVSDPASLRGFRTVPVPDGKYTVVPDANWVASPTRTNGWTLADQGVTARIVVTAVDGSDITDVDFKSEAAADSIMPASMIVRPKILGATVVFECSLESTAASGTIWDIVPKRPAFGDRAAVTDLSAVRFMLEDTLGDFDFCDLRRWTRDLYNGNRGEDWADYAAKNNVKLGGRTLRFDGSNVYTMGMGAQTNLAINVMGLNAVEIYRGEGADVAGTISNTAIAVSSSTVTISYTTTIANFDASLLRVQRNPDLVQGDWEFLDMSRYTVSGSTVTITRLPDAAHDNYRLWYDGVTSSSVECVFRCSARFESALYLRGEDNKLYRISVSGGAISATEVSD